MIKFDAFNERMGLDKFLKSGKIYCLVSIRLVYFIGGMRNGNRQSN